MNDTQIKHLMAVYHHYAVRAGAEQQWNSIVNHLWGTHTLPVRRSGPTRLVDILMLMAEMPASEIKQKMNMLNFVEIIWFEQLTMRLYSDASLVGAVYWNMVLYPDTVVSRGSREEVLNYLKNNYSDVTQFLNAARSPKDNIYRYMNNIHLNEDAEWIVWETKDHRMNSGLGITIMRG